MYVRPSHLPLARLLRQEREAAGLKQSDLARRMGVPQSFVSKCEAGERRVGVLDLRAICQALGIPVGDFLAKLDAAMDSES